MAGRRRAAAGAIVVLGWMAGCGDSASPPAPSPAVEAVVTRIDIEGPTDIAPGTEAQFVVMARLSDGSPRDVTGQSELSMATGCAECSDALTLRDGGIVRALRAGEGMLLATYGQQARGKSLIAVPAGTYRLTGTINNFEGGGERVAGARVDARSAAGAITTTTNGSGQYRLFGASSGTTVSVVKTGYQPLQEVVDVQAHQTVDFQLHPVTKRSSETYTLTIRAASDCAPLGAEGALPADARERRYAATLSTTVDNRVFARLSGARCATVSPVSGGMGGDGFSGAVEAKGFEFSIVGFDGYYYDRYPYPDLVEQISDSLFLVVSGEAHVTGGRVITGKLHGQLALFDNDLRTARNSSDLQPIASCYSTRHEFTLTH